MLKIATHDSATGERGDGLLSLLVSPFAKTQSKTIKEQYDAGCRMFDLRVRKVGSTWKCAHGLWTTKKPAEDIISEIDMFADTCLITITYEGGYKNVYDFATFVNRIRKKFIHTIYGHIAIKYGNGASLFKVKYDYLYSPKSWPKNVSKFVKLDGHSWHILLPIPWLWKKIYYNKPDFNETEYTYVDFL